MRPDLIAQAREARDFYSLTRGILALCEPYGPVHSFKLVHNPGAGNVACIIELELEVPILLDDSALDEWDAHLEPTDPLAFADGKPYPDRVRSSQKSSGAREAIEAAGGKVEAA